MRGPPPLTPPWLALSLTPTTDLFLRRRRRARPARHRLVSRARVQRRVGCELRAVAQRLHRLRRHRFGRRRARRAYLAVRHLKHQIFLNFSKEINNPTPPPQFSPKSFDLLGLPQNAAPGCYSTASPSAASRTLETPTRGGPSSASSSTSTRTPSNAGLLSACSYTTFASLLMRKVSNTLAHRSIDYPGRARPDAKFDGRTKKRRTTEDSRWATDTNPWPSDSLGLHSVQAPAINKEVDANRFDQSPSFLRVSRQNRPIIFLPFALAPPILRTHLCATLVDGETQVCNFILQTQNKKH